MTDVDWEFEIEVQRGVDGDEAARVVGGPDLEGFEREIERSVAESALDLVRSQDGISEGDRLSVNVDVSVDDVRYDNYRVSEAGSFQRYKWFPQEDGFVEVNRSLPWSDGGSGDAASD